MTPLHPCRPRAGALVLAAVLALPLAGLPVWTSAQDEAAAQEDDSLPRFLRLDDVLAAVDTRHPRVQQARAERERATAALEATRAERDLRLDARLEARWIEPNDLVDDRSRNDSRASIVARKLLSDFGRSGAREAAGTRHLEAAREREHLAHARQRIEALERYFDVVLADLAFARDTEDMASAYVSKERAEERNELGQVSDIELFRLESEYQTKRVQRQRALLEQRRTRAALAEALNRPDERVRDPLPPSLPLELPELPELDELLEALDQGNPQLAVERHRVEAAARSVEAARTERRPRLYAEAESGWWHRELGGGDRNPFAAGLVLEVPLYEGRRGDARVGQAVAERQRAEAGLAQARIEARNRLRELYHEAQTLRVQRDEAVWRMDYRELYIDRARYLYDIEDQADLGDSMVQQSAAAHFNAQTEFQLAMTHERLALLTGRPELSPFRQVADHTE